MVTSVEGIYRDGKVELSETPQGVEEGAAVVVTFRSAGPIDLQARGIGQAEARMMLVRGFAFEILERITRGDVREGIIRLVEDKLRPGAGALR